MVYCHKSSNQLPSSTDNAMYKTTGLDYSEYSHYFTALFTVHRGLFPRVFIERVSLATRSASRIFPRERLFGFRYRVFGRHLDAGMGVEPHSLWVMGPVCFQLHYPAILNGVFYLFRKNGYPLPIRKEEKNYNIWWQKVVSIHSNRRYELQCYANSFAI